jgi:hypothetical protein
VAITSFVGMDYPSLWAENNALGFDNFHVGTVSVHTMLALLSLGLTGPNLSRRKQ